MEHLDLTMPWATATAETDPPELAETKSRLLAATAKAVLSDSDSLEALLRTLLFDGVYGRDELYEAAALCRSRADAEPEEWTWTRAAIALETAATTGLFR
jgi:hypothetical protein